MSVAETLFKQYIYIYSNNLWKLKLRRNFKFQYVSVAKIYCKQYVS